jgi:hypothetical protein
MEWINRIFKRFQKKSTRPGKMEISAVQAEKMLQMIQNTQETELSCDDVHSLLDQYTEMAMRGEDAASLLPLVHFHLDMCPDCKEEYEALTRILQAQAG